MARRALQPIVEHPRAEVGALYWRASDPPLLQPLATCALGGTLPALREGEGAYRVRQPARAARSSCATCRAAAPVGVISRRSVGGLIRAQHCAEGDTERERTTDRAGSGGDCAVQGRLHEPAQLEGRQFWRAIPSGDRDGRRWRKVRA